MIKNILFCNIPLYSFSFFYFSHISVYSTDYVIISKLHIANIFFNFKLFDIILHVLHYE